MFPNLLRIFLFLLSFSVFSQTVVINELDADTPGFDTLEFIELKSFDANGNALPNFSLDGYVLVFYNAGSSAPYSGTLSYNVVDLDGIATDINGIALIGNTQVSPTPALTFPNNFIQNGPDVVALYLGNETDFEMKNSFTLKELPPALPSIEQETSNSSYLIPASKLYQKQYVDLKLMMVNLATFYAALIPRADKARSAACNISKVAIPVPGYPLGFYKNPEILTYYAVKGEAEFEGMFNPFSSDSIKLTAYAEECLIHFPQTVLS